MQPNPMINYEEFLRRMRNPDIADVELRDYVLIVPGRGGLDFDVRPNPATVTMTAEDTELENALAIGNGFARLRRRLRFFRNVDRHPDRPVLVDEGDSWHQFPFLIEDVIDKLTPHYNIWSLSAAGATLEEMTSGKPRRGGFEFLKELRRKKPSVAAFLFSGAGNDIIGEHPGTKEPMLADLLRDFNGNTNDIDGHINAGEVNTRIAELSLGYTRILRLIREEPGLENLPIIFHGYDYPFPYPFGSDDPRSPSYAENDQWLGRAFAARDIDDRHLRRNILIRLIDQLYQMLHSLRDAPGQKHVHVVDCRGALPDVTDWNDEIHGTSEGFEEVGRRFAAVLGTALSQS
ncbi:hypothetical protein [Boseongicola sp. H5]|uniref:hypothetical protein n=1 Tax=Boseongicola sp. H5 TaxID=2763261 RepID=UPI001B2E8AC2|nr:hypothetical protein [Boseongicola sp. H5]MBO6922746.1 hypothetical protein [Roseicyclus sp.]